jgi:hypothetical protein
VDQQWPVIHTLSHMKQLALIFFGLGALSGLVVNHGVSGMSYQMHRGLHTCRAFCDADVVMLTKLQRHLMLALRSFLLSHIRFGFLPQ